jgi:hypothetical protein
MPSKNNKHKRQTNPIPKDKVKDLIQELLGTTEEVQNTIAFTLLDLPYAAVVNLLERNGLRRCNRCSTWCKVRHHGYCEQCTTTLAVAQSLSPTDDPIFTDPDDPYAQEDENMTGIDTPSDIDTDHIYTH